MVVYPNNYYIQCKWELIIYHSAPNSQTTEYYHISILHNQKRATLIFIYFFLVHVVESKSYVVLLKSVIWIRIQSHDIPEELSIFSFHFHCIQASFYFLHFKSHRLNKLLKSFKKCSLKKKRTRKILFLINEIRRFFPGQII